MEPECYEQLMRKKDLIQFMRLNPEWYRYLMREPDRVFEMERIAKEYFGKTITQRMDKMQQNIQLIQFLMNMANSSYE